MGPSCGVCGAGGVEECGWCRVGGPCDDTGCVAAFLADGVGPFGVSADVFGFAGADPADKGGDGRCGGGVAECDGYAVVVEVDEVGIGVVFEGLFDSYEILAFFIVVCGGYPGAESFAEDVVGVVEGLSVVPGV